jgi:hypothetical protein
VSIFTLGSAVLALASIQSGLRVSWIAGVLEIRARYCDGAELRANKIGVD